MVHHPADRLLVARNFTSREHDDVLGVETDVAVVVDGDSGKRRLRFPLGARAQADHVLGREVPDVAVLDLHAGWNAEVAEPLGNLGVVDHPAADEGHAAVELGRQIDDDLHPVDARRKGRDHDFAVGVREDLFEGVRHVDFGAREAPPIDVRAVGEESQHSRRAELCQAMDVDTLAVDRGLIDLEVAGVNDHAVGRLDRERDAVGDAVGDAEELDRERADRDSVARPDRFQPSSSLVIAFIELGLDERERQRCAVDRALDGFQHVRHGADVILVPVREHDRRDLVLLKLAEVGDDEVHPEQLRFRKHHARIDEDGRVAARDDHHVHAELAEAAKRHELERGISSHKEGARCKGTRGARARCQGAKGQRAKARC